MTKLLPQPDSAWLSIAETAVVLQIREDQVHALNDEGRIPAHGHTTGTGEKKYWRILKSGTIETLIPSEQWFTVPKIARLIGMGPTFVLELLRAGKIPASAHNSRGEEGKRAHYTVTRRDLVAYLHATANYQVGAVTLQPPGNAIASQ